MTEAAIQESALPLHQTDKPLLRPNQVEEHTEELARLTDLISPATDRGVRSQVADVTEAARQARACTKQLRDYTPRPYADAAELDTAIAEERRLADDIREDMPTRDEMMKTPPGAVDKHRIWERRKKKTIGIWKNIKLRLQASGAGNELPDPSDVANVEMLRPESKARELSLDGSVIGGHTLYMMPTHVAPQNVMDPAHAAALAAETQGLLVKLARTGDGPSQRRCDELGIEWQFGPKPEPSAGGRTPKRKTKAKSRKGRRLTPEQREAARANLDKARLAKKAKQEASEQGMEA